MHLFVFVLHNCCLDRSLRHDGLYVSVVTCGLDACCCVSAMYDSVRMGCALPISSAAQTVTRQ